jgi:hypothetical protein
MIAGVIARTTSGALLVELADLAAREVGADGGESVPQRLTIELCATEGRFMPLPLVRRIIDQFGGARVDAALTLCGRADPLTHPDIDRVIALARESGVAALHLRTCLDRLPAGSTLAGIDILSIDAAGLYGETLDQLGPRQDQIQRLIDAHMGGPGRGDASPQWIVPRIVRCDATYPHIELFYDRWLRYAGAAVIDPLTGVVPGDRISPLPRPEIARRRDHRDAMYVDVEGFARPGTAGDGEGRAGCSLASMTLPEAWALFRGSRERNPESNLPPLRAAG